MINILSLQAQNKSLPIKAWLVSRTLVTIHKEKKDFPAVSSSGSKKASLGRALCDFGQLTMTLSLVTYSYYYPRVVMRIK